MKKGRILSPAVLISLLIGPLPLAVPDALAEQQTLFAVKDNTIYEESSNSNGMGPKLIIGKYADGENVFRRRALLQFDLTELPSNAAVSYARVQFWVDEVEFVSNQSQTLQLHRVDQDWGEGASNDGGSSWIGVPAEVGDSTWTHRFYDSQLWDSAGGDYVWAWSSHTNVPANESEGIIIFPADHSPDIWLLQDIQWWIDYPEANFGWIMHGDFASLQRAVAVASAQGQFSVRRPRLTLVWDIPGEEIGLNLAPVANNLNWPIGVTNAGDGTNRLFVIEQDGVIRIFDPGAGLLPAPFLDISSSVLSPADGGHLEQGLLGLAFHPDFPDTNQFFVNYIYDPPGVNLNRTRVSRFSVSADPNVADPVETVLLEFEQDDDNNNGGDLHFGPDGNLYIATGDGGGVDDEFDNAQNVFTPKGKILRINVDGIGQAPEPCGDTLIQNYTAPTEGFFSGVGDGCDEIFHYGLRNPWRFSFDAKTGFMYIGDRGQDQFEEISWSQPANGQISFGWPCAEGRVEGPAGVDSCFPFQSPAADYPHVAGNCAITGGYIYRGSSSALFGRYIYGDLCTGTIWFAEHSGHWLLSNRWDDPGHAVSALASFGQDEKCEVYVVDRGESENSGALFKIDASSHLKRSGFESYDCR